MLHFVGTRTVGLTHSTRFRAADDLPGRCTGRQSVQISTYFDDRQFIYRRGGREQMSMEFVRMVRAEMAVLQRYSGLCKQQFGRFGSLRLHGRCYTKRGLGRGGLVGRWRRPAVGRIKGSFDRSQQPAAGA